MSTRSRHILILLQRIGRSLLQLAAIAATSSALAAPGDLLFKITAPDPQPGAGFGELLAVVDGDIVVAEPTRSLGLGINALGRAYLFDGQTGTLKLTFDNPEPTNQDWFGRALAAGDGRVFISTSGTESRVFAFDAAKGHLLHTTYSPDNNDGFGASIGYDAGMFLVSDPSFSLSPQLRSVGRAYLFDAANGELRTTLPNPVPQAGAIFGSGPSPVAVGVNRAIVGAHLADLPGDTTPSGLNAGRVWALDTLTGQPTLVLENPNPDKGPPNFFSDRFGASLAANEELIVVSAGRDDTAGAPDSGTVYVFDAKTGLLRHTLFSPHVEAEAEFGHSLAITPMGDVLVGAWNASVNGVRFAGGAYLFDGDTGNLLLDIPNPEPGNSAVFGWSVASFGDRIIVGAPAPGAVYVFEAIPEPSSLVLSLVVVFLLGILAVLTFRHRSFSVKD